MYKKIIWPLLLISALSLAIVFATGFVVSIVVSTDDDTVEPQEQPDSAEDFQEEPIDSEELSDILILGDSIGVGIGDEENLGIDGRYLDLLEEDHDGDETVTNISVSGHNSSQLLELLESGEHSDSISSAQLIIMSIGGNDLNGLAFQRDINLSLAFAETLNTYLANLQQITNEIRTLNPDAQIALIGLYNPYSSIVPGLAPFLLEWNFETRLIADTDDQFAYIPTYELFEYHLEDYLYIDVFHPNGEGYQIIAEQLYTIIN